MHVYVQMTNEQTPHIRLHIEHVKEIGLCDWSSLMGCCSNQNKNYNIMNKFNQLTKDYLNSCLKRKNSFKTQ